MLFLFGQAFRLERWAGVGSGVGQAFRSERRAGVGGELARPSSWRGGLESEARAVPPWPGLLVGEAGRSRKRGSQDRPSGLLLGFWAGPGVVRRSQRRLLGRAFAGKRVHEGP